MESTQKGKKSGTSLQERGKKEQSRNTAGLNGGGSTLKLPHHVTASYQRRCFSPIPSRDTEQDALSEEGKASVPRLREQFRAGLLHELQGYPNWVLWKREHETKVPYHPSGLYRASSTDQHTWGTLQEALSTLSHGGFAGLGFMLDPNRIPLTFIDLDHCLSRDFPTKSIMDLCDQRIFDLVCNTVCSYTEISPSGEGLHMLVRGELPNNLKTQGIEMYDHARYFTVTGKHLAGTFRTIEPRQEELTRLFEAYAPQYMRDEWKREQQPEEPCHPPAQPREVTHHEVELPWRAYFDPRLMELLQGKTDRYGGDESRADFHLLERLLYWTGDNIELTRRLFLDSPLGQREKNGRRKATDKRGSGTYVDMTIQKILRMRTPRPPGQEPGR
jgi:primase-polymerase (primpol)-like protein